MDVFIRYLRGVEIYSFDIAVNSGLLNRWATGPLVLAGLCVNDNPKSEPPPAAAVDAVAMLTDPIAASTPADAATEAFEIINPPAGYLNRGLLNEDEALKLILAGMSPAAATPSEPDSPLLEGKCSQIDLIHTHLNIQSYDVRLEKNTRSRLIFDGFLIIHYLVL